MVDVEETLEILTKAWPLKVNLLIAMMGDTYSKVVDEARMIWQLEQARILFSIENEMSPAEREKELAGYQINIGGELFVQVYKTDDQHFRHTYDEGQTRD